MKHGPIALIDEAMPVLAIVTKDALYDKMISQVQQAKAQRNKRREPHAKNAKLRNFLSLALLALSLIHI